MNKSIFEFLRAVDKVCSNEQKAQIMKELEELDKKTPIMEELKGGKQEKKEKKDTYIKIQVSNTDVGDAFAKASYETLQEISNKVNLKKENDNFIVVAILK